MRFCFMALPVAHFCCLFIFFCLSHSAFCCPPHPPFSCGNFTTPIGLPFFTSNTDPHCRGSLRIVCLDSTFPMIYFDDDTSFNLTNISLNDSTLRFQDPTLALPFNGHYCSFLYNFTEPRRFNLTRNYPILKSEQDYFNCSRMEHTFSFEFLLEFKQTSVCSNYNFYYVNEIETQKPRHQLPPGCVAKRPPLFEWSVLFTADGSVSLLSVGFSDQLVLTQHCFDCKLFPSGCSVNGGQNTLCLQGYRQNNKKRMTGVLSGVGSFLFVAILILFLLYFYNKSVRTSNHESVERFLKEYGSMTPKRYSYMEVRKITKSFYHKLGEGGYGSVFKGTLNDGRMVAVKVLKDSKGDGEEFINEVVSIGKTSHVNVVALLGFCFQGSKRALIYDFMPNGSLDKYIYSNQSGISLDWDKLIQIAIGIARGLEYLHRGCNTRIVHFYIKPHNILLDEEFCPKISDFGLAKLCPQKESILSMTGMRGTIGYIAPEVFCRNFGAISSKSDVYSYGMMVLEMVRGSRNVNVNNVDDSSEVYFSDYIYKQLDREGDSHDCRVMIDREDVVKKMLIIGLWCIQTRPENRPSMSKVVEMLQESVEDLEIPPRPHLSSPPRFIVCSSTVSLSQ